MKQYIGTKLVEAEEAVKYTTLSGRTLIKAMDAEWTAEEAKLLDMGASAERGYRVRYADGYESWSPKRVFEEAYLPISLNENLRSDKPSISAEMVEHFIAQTEVQTLGTKTTLVRATLRNGFEIVEASSCVSEENYDVEIGYEACMKKIKDKVWMLLGFLLQTAVQGVK